MAMCVMASTKLLRDRFVDEIFDLFDERGIATLLFYLFEEGCALVQGAIELMERCQPRKEVISLLERAVLCDNAEAYGRLAWELMFGETNKPDDKKCAFPAYKKRAFDLAKLGTDLGNCTAMGVLALFYGYGYALWPITDEIDVRRARGYELAAKSAAADNDIGLYALHLCCMHGWGAPRDHSRAVELSERSAQLGHPLGLYRMASLYHYGWMLQRDFQKARQYYEQAAEQGSISAMSGLGVLYGRGLGVPKDPSTAQTWIQKGALLKE